MRYRIMSVSYDPILLHTRELILREAGYEVTSVIGFSEAIDRCGEHFDLIVMGHSIPQRDKSRIIAELRAHSCEAPVLSLLKQGERPLREAVDSSTPDPESVLRTVRSLLPNSEVEAAK